MGEANSNSSNPIRLPHLLIYSFALMFDPINLPRSSCFIVLVDPLPILPAHYMVNPFGIDQVPGYCPIQALFKGDRLLPAQFPLDLVAVDGVPAVMAGAVNNIGNLFLKSLTAITRNSLLFINSSALQIINPST